MQKEVKRVDTNLKIRKAQTKAPAKAPTKASTKADLLLQVKSLQQVNEALEESNRKKIKQLESFEERIESLGKLMNDIAKKEEIMTKETQTESSICLNCEECNFEAKSEREIGFHIGKNHGQISNQESDMDISSSSEVVRFCEMCEYVAKDKHNFDQHMSSEHNSKVDYCQNMFACTFCKQAFQNRSDLMKHKKFKHADKVSQCWNFTIKKCSYSDETCWFSHSEITGDDFECNFCDKKFSNQSNFLKHRKEYHKHSVPACRNLNKGTCKFSEKCWFNHSERETLKGTETEDHANENNDTEIKETKEVIQKLFKMMDNFTDELKQMKEINQLK